MYIVMHANKDNSENSTGRPFLQIERLISDREMFGRAEDLSVFAISRGTKSCKATSAVL